MEGVAKPDFSRGPKKPKLRDRLTLGEAVVEIGTNSPYIEPEEVTPDNLADLAVAVMVKMMEKIAAKPYLDMNQDEKEEFDNLRESRDELFEQLAPIDIAAAKVLATEKYIELRGSDSPPPKAS